MECYYLLLIKIYYNLYSTLVDFYIYANVEPFELKNLKLLFFIYVFIIQTEAFLFLTSLGSMHVRCHFMSAANVAF